MGTVGCQSHSQFETLENRQMMAVHPVALAVSQAIVDGGLQLRIQGSRKADAIGVSATADGLLITNVRWQTTVTGHFKSIVIRGGRGNDLIALDPALDAPASIWGSAGHDTIVGGAGD